MIDIKKANQDLGNKSPEEIIAWTLKNSSKPLVSTNFSYHEAVILHMVSQIKEDVKVIWIDSGYNTRETYLLAQKIIEKLKLNIKVYTPSISTMRNDCVFGGIPSLDDERHDLFTEQFKLEPFKRAMKEESPDVWFTAIRSEQTELRANMEVFSKGLNGIIKVAPFLHLKEEEMNTYLKKHNLENVKNYFDPTKGLANRECGLHSKL